MKHFILLQITLLLSFSTCNSQQSDEFQIGIKQNDGFVITTNLDKVKAHWNSVMKLQKNQQQISEIAIISGVDQETRETYYLISGKNAEGTFTIANEVYLINNEFFFKNNDVMGTVSCSGCSYACHPEKVRKRWYCSSGCGSNCSKTETISY